MWGANPVSCAAAAHSPGTIVDAGADGIVVAAGTDAVSILELQKAGARRMNAAAFLGGSALGSGTRLGT